VAVVAEVTNPTQAVVMEALAEALGLAMALEFGLLLELEPLVKVSTVEQVIVLIAVRQAVVVQALLVLMLAQPMVMQPMVASVYLYQSFPWQH